MGVFKSYSNFLDLKNNVKNLFNCKKKTLFVSNLLTLGSLLYRFRFMALILQYQDCHRTIT